MRKTIAIPITIFTAFVMLGGLPAPASQASGTGTTTVCVGGPPVYCANSTASKIMLRSPINYPALDPNDGGPAVGVPFTDPDTGSRETRITDEMTIYGGSVAVVNNIYVTNSSAEAYSLSNFNPAIGDNGGYQGWFLDMGGQWQAVLIDAKTLQTTVLKPSNWGKNGGYILAGGVTTSEPSTSWTDPWATFYGGAGMTINAYCIGPIPGVYPGTPSGDPFCGSTVDAPVLLHTLDSGACPGLPAGATGVLSEVQTSSDDKIFGGWVKGRYYIVLNTTTSSCDWYDTFNNQVGGSDVSGTTTNWTGLPAPLTTGTASPVTGTGSLAAGTYCFEQAWVPDTAYMTAAQQTLPSTPICQALTATGEFTVNRPALSTGTVTARYFEGGTHPSAYNTFACFETSYPTQCTDFQLQNSTPTPYATPSFTVSSLASLGAAPTANTAGFNIHQGRLSPNGLWVELVPSGTAQQSLFGWMVGTTQVNEFYQVGHTVPLNNTILYNNGGGSISPGWNTSNLDISITNASPSFNASRINSARPSSTFSGTGDWHPNAADDYTTTDDKLPFCGTMDSLSFNSLNWGPLSLKGPSPNGSTINFPTTGYNPAWSTMTPGNGEILCQSMDGPGTTWRFGSARSSSWSRNTSDATFLNSTSPTVPGGFYTMWSFGTISRDGKIMMFTSDMDWQLGTQAYWGWAPNTAYHTLVSGSCPSGDICTINDSNENLETAQSNFTSGTTIPVFSTNPVILTDDGGTSGAWKMSVGCPTTTALHVNCRNDVFVAELK